MEQMNRRELKTYTKHSQYMRLTSHYLKVSYFPRRLNPIPESLILFIGFDLFAAAHDFGLHVILAHKSAVLQHSHNIVQLTQPLCLDSVFLWEVIKIAQLRSGNDCWYNQQWPGLGNHRMCRTVSKTLKKNGLLRNQQRV